MKGVVMQGFLDVLGRAIDLDKYFTEAITDVVCVQSLTPFLLSHRASTKPIVIVTHSSRRAEDIGNELSAILGKEAIIQFPAWETLPHEKLSPKSDTVAQRIHALYQLQNATGKAKILIAPIRALIQPLIGTITETPLLQLEIGKEISLSDLVSQLTFMAYNRTDLVERRGDFAVRGGIVDIFPPLDEHPVRIEFFGDDIEEMRYFAVSDQRTFAPFLGKLEILPCRELLITNDVKARALALAGAYPELSDICTRISQGTYVEGMESLASALSPSMKPLLSYLSKGSELILLDEERNRSRTLDLVNTSNEFLEAAWSNAANGGATPIDLRNLLGGGTYSSFDELREYAQNVGNFGWRSINNFGGDDSTFIEDFLPHEPYKGNNEKVVADIANWFRNGYLVLLSAHSHGLADRFFDILVDSDVPVRKSESIKNAPTRDGVIVTTSSLEFGFINDDIKVVLITDKDISGHRNTTGDGVKMPSRRKKTIDPLELKAGDYVVHEQHGVGRYIELVKRDFGGAIREYLVIEYASSKRGQPGDRIYVPTDGLEQVTRYVGGEAPAVHRIGGSDWIKAKSRARKAVKEIAGELIRLYAARTSAPGFAFSADTPWQRELEDAFVYVETPDQLSTIDEVKRDMERPYPMDRVVCGDVGYGKTEIAVRAAFKAVQDGKQVAVLVPTTLLVQQHLATFTDRYTGFPIKVAGLSRFNSTKENKEILDGLAHGSIDIVIGTHRLLSQDVVIRDLGLVIVDEEQRFGVEHKESLKKMRTSVDVLSMSATPIPRTLEMAITGIREMSTITTPPEERHPVLTYVGPQDDKQVTAAIHRELLRDGQIFYIHNRVESIDIAAAKLRILVPEARIAIAHGQMNETALEEVILAFWNREFDILVCTTIIENGIDVANANTLLVERADLFGLSQLHQIRGRVGRSRERAYAYFLYPADKPLTELALDRLTTISTHTDLGSGMQVALKDLEIRGAGNLLGGEQSGHIADVGFDLYMRMVGEAVNEYKTGYFEETPRLKECRIELPVTAHLPHDYIPGERLRLDIYRRLADAQQERDIDAIREEMVDRFGEPTSVVNVLLKVAALRVMAKNLGITEVILQGNYLRIGEVLLPESTQLRMQRLYPGTLIKSAIKVILIARPKAPLNLQSGRSSIADSSESEEIRNTELLTWAMQAITSTK
mgnify:FL=1